MKFTAPGAPATYSQPGESTFRDLLARFLIGVLRGDQDAELQPKARLIMTSPSGQRWAISISDLGILTSTAL